MFGATRASKVVASSLVNISVSSESSVWPHREKFVQLDQQIAVKDAASKIEIFDY